MAMTNSSGQIVERYGYTPYRKRRVVSPSGATLVASAVENQVGFTGRYHDGETRLTYFRARYQDAELGRFVGRDPLGYVDGANRYGFLRNAPVNFVDPTGLGACAEPSECNPMPAEPCTEAVPPAEPPAPPPPEAEPTPPAPELEPEPKIYFAGTLVGTLPRSLLFPQWRAVARGNAIAVAIVAALSIPGSNPQQCTDARKGELQDAGDQYCHGDGFACTGGMPCNVLLVNIELADACARARRMINRECFSGGDRGHRIAQDAAGKAAAKCPAAYRNKKC